MSAYVVIDFRNQNFGAVKNNMFNLGWHDYDGSIFDKAAIAKLDLSNIGYLKLWMKSSGKLAGFPSIKVTNSSVVHLISNNYNAGNLDFSGSYLAYSKVKFSRLSEANFSKTIWEDSSFENSNLKAVNFEGAGFINVSFLHVKNWQQIKSINGANIAGIRDAPVGFREWALANGAIEDDLALWKAKNAFYATIL